MAKAVNFFIVIIFACAITEHIGISNKHILSEDTEQLTVSVVHILCNFNASFIYVYFENNASTDFTWHILKSINKCGTSLITLEYDSNDENVAIVHNDGVMMYLLMILNDADEPINLSHVRKKSADKHRSFFIILLETSQRVTTGWLRSTFQRFWERWILNVVVIFWDNELRIYTYSPFSKFFLRKLPAKTFRKDKLFSMNILNMHRHDLRISLYPEEVRAIFLQNGRLKGSDGFMTELIVHRMNATKVIVVPDDNYSGEIYNNTLADGSIGLIVRDDVDVALNTRYLLRQKFEFKVENTHVYGRDDLCVMVPAAKYQTPRFHIFRSFDRNVWIIVLAIPVVVYFLIRILFPIVDFNFVSVIGSMLRNSVPTMPNTSAIRILMAFWLSYCLIILIYYEGNMTSNIVLPRKLPLIDTIKQLVDSPLDILIYKRFAPHIQQYLNSSMEAHLELKKRIRAVPDEYFQDRIRANDLTKAYIDKNHSTMFRINSRSHTSRGTRLFYRMNECPIPFYTVYVVPYGSPYLGFINKILRKSQENGIILYWDKHMEINEKLSGKFLVLHKRSDDDVMVIKMIHLQIAIYILLLGLLASCICFIVEIFLYHRSNQERVISSIDLADLD